MLKTTAAAQAAVGMAFVRAQPLRGLREFLTNAPAPATRGEELIRYGLLFEMLAGGFGSNERTTAVRVHRVVARVGVAVRSSAVERRKAVLAAARYIVERLDRPLDVAAVARHAGIGETTLRRAFVRAFGLTLRDYQGVVRVCQASRIFAQGTTDVSAVAREVGYRSDKNFCRAVRKITGRTPAELRDEGLPCRGPSLCPQLPGQGCWKERGASRVLPCATSPVAAAS